MEQIRLNEIFNIVHGNQLDLNKQEIDLEHGINFVSRSSDNLGISTQIKAITNTKPFRKSSITVTLGGTYLLSSFVQPQDFYTAQNIKVLTPKYHLTELEKYFYCYIITQNRYRYTSHGREANKTLENIKVPHPDEVKKIVANYSLPKQPSKKPASKNRLSLNYREWKCFALRDIFDIEKGERLVKNERVNGVTPIITASSINNGVAQYVDYEFFREKKKVFENKITVDMFFNVFYHSYKYFSDDNVCTLIPKFPSNTFISLFIASVLKFSQYKYTYGRQLRMNKFIKEKTKLPVDKNNNPDWQFMEGYIRSLPYSSNL